MALGFYNLLLVETYLFVNISSLVDLVTATKEVLALYSATLAQGSAHARLMLKGTSARDARMEHTIVTQTILMDVHHVSASVDLRSALLLLALLSRT